MKSIALLLFDGIELMDFAGPLEVFSVANKLHDQHLVTITIVSPRGGPIQTANGLKIEVDRACADVEQADFLIVPGGVGTRKLLSDPILIEWIAQIAAKAPTVLSICSGSLLLGKAGLLDGLEATTHHAVFDELAGVAPGAKIVRGVRFTDNGKIVTSGGISAGIDASFHVLEKHFGAEVAAATASHMEYRRSRSD